MAKKDYSITDFVMRAEMLGRKAIAKGELRKVKDSCWDKFGDSVDYAEREKILTGENVLRGKLAELVKIMRKFRLTIVDASSANGIPDMVLLRGYKPNEVIEDSKGTAAEAHHALPKDCDKLSRVVQMLPCERSFQYLCKDNDLIKALKIGKHQRNGQALTGSCNAREEEAVKFASRLTKLSFSAFVTKATLYMARFINRHRRNEQGHPYHPGEAYLFMEHGERMQDAFTPEEVQQAMEKVGISGSRIANDLKAELERLRDARMNPDLMAGGSPQAHP